MSEQNVERFRAAIDDFLAVSSEEDWDAWLARATGILHPEIVWDASEGPAPDIQGVYRGREEVMRWWQQWLSAWETVQFEYELLDAGDRVVLLLDQRMRGRSTGIEVPMGKYAQVATFEDGLMVHWKTYASQSKALEDAGLEAVEEKDGP